MSMFMNFTVHFSQDISFFIFILTFPIASSPLSNNSNTPRNKKATPNPANPSPAVYGPGEFSHDLNNPQSIVNVRNNMIHKISVLSLKKITCPS